jgi:hypothetical protein
MAMGKKTSEPRQEFEKSERIEALQRKIKDQSQAFEADDLPPELHAQFWDHIAAYEEAEWATPFDMLVRSGLALPSPEELDDAQLTAKLWETIRSLAMLRMFLSHTDHLSDRELYEELWHDVLREEGPIMPLSNDSSWHIDLLGGGSEEDSALYLRHYADAETRQQWAQDWPGDILPASETPPYDRDRHLPASEQAEWRVHDHSSWHC